MGPGAVTVLGGIPQRAAEQLHDATFSVAVRSRSAEEAYDVVRRLLSAGVDAVELAATIPGWSEVFTALRPLAGRALLGIGTVATPAVAAQAVDVGARFLASPSPAPCVRPVAQSGGALFIEGGYRAHEIAEVATRGVARLHPAHVGGIPYLRSLLADLPRARIIPSGGIPLADVPKWLDAGAYAVSVGPFTTVDEVDEVDEALGGLVVGRRLT